MSDEQQATPAGAEKAGQKKVFMIVGAVVAIALLGGIASRFAGQSASERTLEAVTGGKVNVDSRTGEVTVKTDEGTWVGSDKLPADFPADAPVYPGAKVQSSVTAATGQAQGGHYVGLETNDNAAVVAAWYKGELAAKGWSSTVAMETSEGSLLGGSKGDRQLMVTVAGADGKTSITIAVSQK